MCNVDGLFAKSAIKEGSVVMTEHEMPDCELAVSETPNCEVCNKPVHFRRLEILDARLGRSARMSKPSSCA